MYQLDITDISFTTLVRVFALVLNLSIIEQPLILLNASAPVAGLFITYLWLSSEHEEQLHVLVRRELGSLAWNPCQFLPAQSSLILAKQRHHQVVVQTADGTLVERAVEECHTEPHNGRHTRPSHHFHECRTAAHAVAPGAKLHGVQAAAGVEPP